MPRGQLAPAHSCTVHPAPAAQKILNTWLSKCAFGKKVELSLRKSARKKFGPDSGLRFVDEILTLN